MPPPPCTSQAINNLQGTRHVLNAPSPAATAALAIGRWIAERAREHLG